MEPETLKFTPEEEFAFYWSGLIASGCNENIDEYMEQSIIRYGRILVADSLEKKILKHALIATAKETT
jgi:hypothetical protein